MKIGKRKILVCVAAVVLCGLCLCSCGDILGDKLGIFPEVEPPEGYEEEKKKPEGPLIPVGSTVFDYSSDKVTAYKYQWSEDGLTVSAGGVVQTVYAFDGEGNRLSTVRYDAAGRKVKVTEYDRADEKKEISVTRYTYDGDGALACEECRTGDGELLRYLEYTPEGEIAQGYAYEYEYEQEGGGRLLREIYTAYGEDTESEITVYTYGTPEDETAVRLLSSETKDGAGTVLRTVEYDAGGRPAKEAEYEGGVPIKQWTKEYDGAGVLCRQVYESVDRTHWESDYDEFGNLVKEITYQLTDEGAAPPEETWEREEYAYAYEKDDAGRTVKWTALDEDGKTLGSFERRYGEDGTLLCELSYNEKGALMFGWEEERGEDGALLSRTDHDSGEKQVVRYDDAGRVTAELSYDEDGKILRGEESVYTPSGILARKTTYLDGSMDSRLEYSYDGEGNLTKTLAYDKYGNLDYRFELHYQDGNMKNAATFNGEGGRMASYSVEWSAGSDAQRAFAGKYLSLGLVGM